MSTDDTLIRCWYARLPKGLAPVFPRVAAALGDGAWTTAWIRIAAWAPVVVFGAGLFVPRTWPGTQVVYTESPLFLGMGVALSILSGTWGVALLLAHGLREVLSHDMASSLSAVVHVGAARFVAWLLLGVLVVMLPQFAHLLTEAGIVRMRFLRNTDMRAVCRALLLALIYAGLVFVWCQAATILVRPVFVWSGGSPSPEAVSLVTGWWPWLAAAAAGAAVVRCVLEGVVAPRMRLASYAAALARERGALENQAGGSVAVGVAGMAMLLAGLFDHPEDAVVAGLLIGLLAMLARGIGAGWLTGGWAIGMDRMPAVLRVAIALGGGYLLTDRALASAWSGTALRGVMAGTLFTITLLFVLFPGLDTRPWRPPLARGRR